MRRAGGAVAVLAWVQLGLIGAWWLVERGREAPPRATVGAVSERRIALPVPPLALRGLDGTARRLDGLRGPALVHVWATWCPPCRAELPGLMAAAAEAGLPLWSISVDREAEVVRRFFGGAAPASVWLADAVEVERRLAVSALPVTFFVDRAGVLRRRWDGARDWRGADRGGWEAGRPDEHGEGGE